MPCVAEPFSLSNGLWQSSCCAISYYAEPSGIATHWYVPWRPNTGPANKCGKQWITGTRDHPTSISRLINTRADVLSCYQPTSTEYTTQISGKPAIVVSKPIPTTAKIHPLETQLQRLVIRHRPQSGPTTASHSTAHGTPEPGESTTYPHEQCSLCTIGAPGICRPPRNGRYSHTPQAATTSCWGRHKSTSVEGHIERL